MNSEGVQQKNASKAAYNILSLAYTDSNKGQEQQYKDEMGKNN